MIECLGRSSRGIEMSDELLPCKIHGIKPKRIAFAKGVFSDPYCPKCNEDIVKKYEQEEIRKWNEANASDELLKPCVCRFCGGIPGIHDREEKTDFGCVGCSDCFHAIEIKLEPFESINFVIKKWNARNEKHNPFIKDKENAK